MAPEVLQQRRYDKRVDIFSLGVILYLLLSGTLPFDDDDDKKVAHMTIHEEISFRGNHWKRVSQEAKDLIQSKNLNEELTNIRDVP